MASSGILTVFGEPPGPGIQLSSLLVSAVLHAGFFSLLTLRLLETQRILERFPPERFAVRFVDFHSSERQIPAPAMGGVRAPEVYKRGSGGGSAGSPAATRISPNRMPASQTLIQPDLRTNVALSEKAPVPLIVVWTPDQAEAKRVVPSPPQAASISVTQPSLEAPIREEKIADLRVSSSSFVTQGPAARPSTTSPIVVAGPEEEKRVPETTSKQSDPSPSGRVISLSDLRVADGKVAVPVANQTAAASPGMLVPGQLRRPAPAGEGVSELQGVGKAAGGARGKEDGASGEALSAADHAGSGVQNGPAKAPISNPEKALASNGPGTQPVRISFPRDGQFGVVVLGSSVADQYPETAEMWSGRMASTVYLHVGLARNWILQYAQPRLAEAEGHLDAPWPYEIVRPSLDPGDANSDAVIVHGFVNGDGRFERLEVVFPAALTQAPAWLSALNQWQFRPAKLAGQTVPVEVLLIVPEQSE